MSDLASLLEKVAVDDLAQIIRRVDGNHSLGAGELAEAILAALSPPIKAREAVPVAWHVCEYRPLYASPQPEAYGVRVKPLEWKARWVGSNEDMRAWEPTNSLISAPAFRIYMDGDDWETGTCDGGKHANLAAAKAAKQADYEARILAALEPTP
jgi:hypothetical protein